MDFPEHRTIIERGTIMKRTHLIAVLVGLIAIGVFAADAAAYYHPGMGRFTSRDPGAGAARVGAGALAVGGGFITRDPKGYVDGMSTYPAVATPM
jgi:hypothetical protein